VGWAAYNVIVPLCTLAATGSKTGTGAISASLLKTIQKHGTYVNAIPLGASTGDSGGPAGRQSGMQAPARLACHGDVVWRY
jgi:hypothetical protein